MRKGTIILAAAVLLLPAVLASAANGPVDLGSRMSIGDVQVAATSELVRTVTVPIILDNKPSIAAIDLPLNYGQPGQGISLVEVTYASRVDYFDMKITNIDDDNKNVIMGLIAMATDPNTKDLANGKGAIANLRFEVTDPTMSEFVIRSTEMESPSHRLILVSHDFSSGQPEIVWEEPEFNYTVRMAGAGPLVPSSYSLVQNYPNPFNAGTVIRFNVPRSDAGDLTNVKLVVYNVLGQAVRTLVDEQYTPGSHQATWDGTNDHGTTVSSGVYFYRMQAGNFTDTKKMTLLK
ncbi:MAG TPA: FlgD immunoglobulin-like domain containing protein [candidate division Zixibacteria bacterium]|jgi:hypothetical protein